MDDRWISVPGWERHQSYKARHPGWIKVYTELNSRDDWLNLTWGQRGVLVTLWLEYARADRRLRARSVRQLASRGSAKDTLRFLAALNHAGFIDFMGSLEVDIQKEKEVDPDALIHIREMTERINRR